MKHTAKSFIALLALVSSAPFAATATVADEEPDTVSFASIPINDNDEVSDPEDNDISVSPLSDEHFALPFSKTGKKKVQMRFLRNFYAGMAWGTDHYPGLKNGWEVAVAEVIGIGWTPAKKGPTIAIGLGAGWRGMAAARGWLMERQESGRLDMRPAHTAQGERRSSMQMFSFTIPVSITQPLYKDFAVSAAGIVNLNTYATAHTQLDTPECRYDTDIRRLHQRPLTIDIMGTIGWRDHVGLYVKYSPLGWFTTPNGPRFHTMSVGVNFAF